MMFVPIIRASWKVTLIIRIYTRSVFNLSEEMFFLELGLLTLSAKAQEPSPPPPPFFFKDLYMFTLYL